MWARRKWLHGVATVSGLGSPWTNKALSDCDGVPDVSELPYSLPGPNYSTLVSEVQRERTRLLRNVSTTNSAGFQVSFKTHGREAMKGEFISAQDIHAIVARLCVKPFFPRGLVRNNEAHGCVSVSYRPTTSAASPTVKFGYGALPTMETLDVIVGRLPLPRACIASKSERNGLAPTCLSWPTSCLASSIPRRLGLLKSDGRSVKPSLVHVDLRYGNASGKECRMYDSASFYAHHECTRIIIVPTVLQRQWCIFHGALLVVAGNRRTGGTLSLVSNPASCRWRTTGQSGCWPARK